MKLWKKISLICGCVLSVVLTCCTASQLYFKSSHLLETAHDQAAEKFTELSSSFLNTFYEHSRYDDPPVVRRSLMIYSFEQVSDGTGVLIYNGECLVGEALVPSRYLPQDDWWNLAEFSGVVDGRNLLIIGKGMQPIYTEVGSCYVYVVEDLTGIYDQIHSLTLQYIGIALLGIILGLVLIILVVRKSLKPMQVLQKTAGEIAAGNYSQRAQITSRDEVGELAASFNHMADAVQTHIEAVTEAAEKQRLFVGAVTHEFKTPLTGILLNVDNLQNTYMNEEEREAALCAIENQGKWLERMVQKMLKLLTLSRHFSPTAVSAAEVCQKAAAGAKGILREREITLDTHVTDFPIQGDPDLLQSALVNLIDNASKASQPGQKITLHAENGRITISDHGCGISKEALPHITDAFYMADKSRSKRQGGVGLGLALVQEIVNVHGAKLVIESTSGVGTTVSIDFPSQRNEG